MSGIMVLAEHRHGDLRDVSHEVLSAARNLAEKTGEQVEAVLLGQGCDEMAQRLAAQAHRVIHAEHPAFRDFNYETWQQALVRLVKGREPSIVMIPHTAFGTDLGPSLAVELGVGIVSDAIGFEPGPDGLKVTRGVYGGKLNAERFISTTPALVMVRQSHFKPDQPGLEGEVVNWDPGDVGSGLRTRFISLEEVPSTGIDITKADVVVGIGRGVKEEKNIGPIREFAEHIGAVLAGSRPVIDAGWLEKERQVGSSGKTVKPRVYIALGISGAFQHVAGMTGSDTIIAVNKDPHAPIFAVAHYGIVDDLHKVVPALREKLA
ncbi:MAG: electron transfer flavoprotein subunit alpha/FixB family protein [candidate division WOR-3 bacterium]|nr:MAG: electron transfer flavoprotein subunit alpha/FixB family protein [candidate division WOR-3 bacterium]